MKTIGFVLVVLGVLALVYGGINYNRNRTVLDVGSMHVTATEHRTFQVPALVGVIVLVGGVGMLLANRRRA